MSWALWCGSLLILAALGHAAFWYLPRERLAQPRPGGAPFDLLFDDSYPVRLWVPYPHQNLGGWRQKALVAAVGEVAGGALKMPSFGPFAVPPARELTVAAGHDRARVVAEVYPALALVARAAGRLASNPWLAGGKMTIAGTPVSVEWKGALWSARWSPVGSSGGGTAARAGVRSSEDLTTVAGEHLALLALDPETLGVGWLPMRSGVFTAASAVTSVGAALSLRRIGSHSGLNSESSAVARPAPVDSIVDAQNRPKRMVTFEGSVFARMAERPEIERELVFWGTRSCHGEEVEALFLLGHQSERGELRVPSAALFFRHRGISEHAPGGSRAAGFEPRFHLPGEGLQSRLGVRPRDRKGSHWSVVATDRRGLRAAEPFLVELEGPALGPAAGGQPSQGCGGEEWSLWLRPVQAYELVRGVRLLLETVPLGGRRELERWRRYERWLRSLRGFPLTFLTLGPETVDLVVQSSAGNS